MKLSNITILILGLIASLFIIIAGILKKEPSVSCPWDLTMPKMAPIESAIDAYKLNTGQYPKTLDDLLSPPQGVEKL